MTHKKGRQPYTSDKVRPIKSLGQNFLRDQNVVAAIVDGAELGEDDLCIEIGPGTGALTLPLAERAGHVTAVELDERVIPGLRVKTFSLGNVDIIHEDILKVDLEALISENLAKYGLKEVRIVGNLPYYITTPIIMKLLEEETGAASITVMMQKEVADRIAAEPGTKPAGAITYSVHYYAEVSRITDVGRESFYPVPKVDSAVLRLDLREEHPVKVADEDLYFNCIHTGEKLFSTRLCPLADMKKQRSRELSLRPGSNRSAGRKA